MYKSVYVLSEQRLKIIHTHEGMKDWFLITSLTNKNKRTGYGLCALSIFTLYDHVQ
ncbi:hypothetical protein JCM19045_4930 [Bacillus sp. JCM 19045]|nr:hypothetical protein JCM19045_4930 [Bacillus sp. JCM 19045]